ncbi:hypothetical protein GWK16_05830 [Roseomonas sp. JC162]|uniref:Uncharacterized protein n=1 Tax=Neoroseomonas marina TaxID=1232220 RepID=A0A848E8I7_9PROT|nr:hypothetical protein [Neoroseomonas marina]NMJ40751.1 hypothetical protein [Neoroseomonas marina]
MARFDIPLLVTVILLFPMLYFAIASLTFYLRSFDDPIVTWMLRGLFGAYFLAVAVCCSLGAAVFLMAGRPFAALGFGVLVAGAVTARPWFLQRLDEQIRARDAGDRGAAGRLRRLQLGGIVYNAAQAAAVIGSIPLIFAPPAA